MEDEGCKPAIEVLPDELMLYIFSWLPLPVVKTQVAAVCQRWYHLSQDNSIYKYLYIGPNYGTEQILKTLKSAPQLARLHFFGRKDLNEVLTAALGVNKRLKYFKINTGKEQRNSLVDGSLLLNYLNCCTPLVSVTLKRTTLEESAMFFAGLGYAVPRLKKINLNHSLQLGTEDLTKLIECCEGLEDVRLYCLAFDKLGSVTPYSDTPVKALLTKMSATLKVLKLNMLGVTGRVMDSLGNCALLERLHLYRLVNVDDEALCALGSLSKLRELVITVPRALSSEGWLSVLSCPNMSQLTSLTLSNSCTVDDQVVSALASTCPSLLQLSLPGCRQVTHRGVTEVIRSCHSLSYLNLYSTKSLVSESFRLIPQHLPNLKVLIYRPNDKIRANFTNLKKQMPNLEIHETYRYP